MITDTSKQKKFLKKTEDIRRRQMEVLKNFYAKIDGVNLRTVKNSLKKIGSSATKKKRI